MRGITAVARTMLAAAAKIAGAKRPDTLAPAIYITTSENAVETLATDGRVAIRSRMGIPGSWELTARDTLAVPAKVADNIEGIAKTYATEDFPMGAVLFRAAGDQQQASPALRVHAYGTDVVAARMTPVYEGFGTPQSAVLPRLAMSTTGEDMASTSETLININDLALLIAAMKRVAGDDREILLRTHKWGLSLIIQDDVASFVMGLCPRADDGGDPDTPILAREQGDLFDGHGEAGQ